MTIDGHGDLRGAIETLLQFARPGGQADKKLNKYLDMIERNVFLGPVAFKYIQELISKTDNIECNSLNKRQAACRKTGKPCPHTKLYRNCAKYIPRKPEK